MVSWKKSTVLNGDSVATELESLDFDVGGVIDRKNEVRSKYADNVHNSNIFWKHIEYPYASVMRSSKLNLLCILNLDNTIIYVILGSYFCFSRLKKF